MKHNIIEIKAKCHNQAQVRKILKKDGADFKGIDHQIDTYFKVNNGRLKLREGNIENYLIHYNRVINGNIKKSDVTLYKSRPNSSLKKILIESLGILTVVDKKREIYFIDNIKFHIDTVQNLGDFMEIEAIDSNKKLSEKQLEEQCQKYIKKFNIKKEDLIADSYSDLILNI